MTKNKTTFEECELQVHVNEVTEEQAYVDYEEEEIIDFEENITNKQAETADLKELGSIADFEVYDEVPDTGQKRENTRFVRKRKSADLVKSRLVVTQLKAKTKHVYDRDELYASTPSFCILRLLLIMALAMGLCIFTCDVSTAFLHADLPTGTEVFVQPPEPYCKPGILWKLKKALYGLRAAPAAWQKHFAKVVTTSLHFTRSKYDPNVYFAPGIWILVHVDDILLVGSMVLCRKLISDLSKHLLMKETGNLNDEHSEITFLGRLMKRTGDAILFIVEQSYYDQLFEEGGVTGSRSVTSPGMKTRDVMEHPNFLDATMHALYRKLVGKLQWIVPLRGEMSFATKELARRLCEPTDYDMLATKHALKYLIGTRHYVYALRPRTRLGGIPKILDVDAYADSDWAGCRQTRKSTSGICIQVLGTTCLFASRTQESIALSSGEAELYAVGSTTAEGLFVCNFLKEVGLAEKTQLVCYTDSTAGKSLATRFGTSKRTRHIDTRLLYMQELVERGLLRLRKVPGTENVADLGTKHLNGKDLEKFLERIGLEENYHMSTH